MNNLIGTLLIVVGTLPFATIALGSGRAADGEQVVLHRMYQKQGRIEVAAGMGLLLNPAFVETIIPRAEVRYHWSESWGLGVMVGLGLNSDKDERRCVESFYNDPLKEAGAVCHDLDGGESARNSENVDVGPAYVPIREMKQVVMAFGEYTLAYGKQILLHGATSHFDLRVRFGAGVVIADQYEQRTYVRGDPGRPSRGDPKGRGDTPRAGVEDGEADADGLLYGEEGRPTPVTETMPAGYLALAEELQFARRMFLVGELGSFLMITPDRGFDPAFVAHIGLGVRF